MCPDLDDDWNRVHYRTIAHAFGRLRRRVIVFLTLCCRRTRFVPSTEEAIKLLRSAEWNLDTGYHEATWANVSEGKRLVHAAIRALERGEADDE